MRKTKVSAGVLIACTALATMAMASSASAALPELGRCVAVEKTVTPPSTRAHYTGGYGNKNCTKVNANHRGQYEWLPGPGVARHFYAVAGTPEPVLETVGGSKVECASITATGEYTGPKSEKISKLQFAGCSSNGKGCQSNPAKEGEFEVTELEGELGVIKGPPGETAGWDLKKSGSWVTFTCGTTENPTVEMLEGSVIGEVAKNAYGDLNKMSKESYIRYKETSGKQIPESFEGQPTDVLSTTLTKFPAGQSKEQTGLLATFESSSGFGKPSEEAINEEALEIRTKPEGT